MWINQFKPLINRKMPFINNKCKRMRALVDRPRPQLSTISAISVLAFCCFWGFQGQWGMPEAAHQTHENPRTKPLPGKRYLTRLHEISGKHGEIIKYVLFIIGPLSLQISLKDYVAQKLRIIMLLHFGLATFRIILEKPENLSLSWFSDFRTCPWLPKPIILSLGIPGYSK